MPKPTLSVNEYVKLATFNNIVFVGILLVLTQLGCNVYFSSNLGIIALGLVGGTLLNGFFGILNFWPHLILQKFVKKPKPAVTTSKVVDVKAVESVRQDILADYKSPYLKPNAKPIDEVLLGDKPADIYSFKDMVFDFHRKPHTLLVGESGVGKTVALFNIIGVLKKQYPLAKFVVIDYGNQDFSVTYPTDLNTFLSVTDAMFYIMKGRQQEGKDPNRTRIIWLVEEFESALGEIRLLPKADQDRFNFRLANIGRMARKLAINMVFVTQSAKAEDFNTSTRNNFASRFIMGLENDKLASALGCPYKVAGLPTGLAYANAIKAFVKFDMATEPPLELIPYSDLIRLGNFYKNKYNLEEDGDR